MKIADSAIHLYSKNTATVQQQIRQSLLLWQNGREPPITGGDSGSGNASDLVKEIQKQIADQVSLSTRNIQPADAVASDDQEMLGDLNMRILQAVFERLTGRKFQVFTPVKATAPPVVASVPAVQGQVAAPVAAAGSAGYGLVYDYHQSRSESEKTDFTASGKITTADGRTIDFSVGLSMSRQFSSEQNINVRAGDALKDPLVINFSGAAAQLTQRDFSFDIDADGKKEQIAFVAPGSGFLALDKNNDGKINNGSELFGTASGNGFGDLRAYDDNGNNWIDENDAIYSKLRIWSKDNAGNDQLIALGKAGVGAIFLGHIETPFSLKDDKNAMLGQVRETGLALMESGRVVTLQQVDLVA